eukprot:TRINITY_DN10295_c0_g1_i1.p1 TRINITY_DN10295_c0_g1~~TRINITY_DN10295_c0_g1_i1.p1  ORF type:complete len:181 (-),score=33.53 TRINITY_DN10295_c0_g1_i1:61-603(-)
MITGQESTPPTIRKFSTDDDDLSGIEYVVNDAYRGTNSKAWTTEGHLVSGPRITISQITDLLAADKNTLYIAEINGKIVGTINVIKLEADLYEFGMFSVLQSVQGQGVGKVLLDHAEGHVKQLNGKRIQLHVVHVRNELLEWYKRKGFQDTGVRETFHPHKDEKTKVEGLQFVVLEKKLE